MQGERRARCSIIILAFSSPLIYFFRDAEAVLAVQDPTGRAFSGGPTRLTAVKLSYPHTATDVLEKKRVLAAGGHVFMGTTFAFFDLCYMLFSNFFLVQVVWAGV